MKLTLFLPFLSFFVLCTDLTLGQPQRQPIRQFQLPQALKKAPAPSKVVCTADSLMIYQDCRVCVCPRPHRAAKCFRKTCDLRTKDSGQCPSTILRLDDNKLCPGSTNSGCRTDNDCPENLVCCFDFCKGNQCIAPAPLDPGMAIHRGRGFA